MVKLSVVAMILGIGLLACISGSKTTCIAEGTVVAIGRTNPTGACPADVTAGIALVNQMITLGKDEACGNVHFAVNLTFVDQAGSGASCMGSSAVTIPDLGSDGGDGTDVMAVTCANGTTCTENFDVTWTPQ